MFREMMRATFLRVIAAATIGVALSACNPGTSPAAIALSSSSYSVGQNAGAVTMTVARTGSAADAISVSYATADGTAMAGADYVATSGILQWAENDSTSKTITVPLRSAQSFSGDRSFKLVLKSPSTKARIGNPDKATVTIAGNAATSGGLLQFAAASYSVAQGAGSLTVTVNRTGGSSGAALVYYSMLDGTAVAGTDYTAATGTLQWADGDASSKTFSVAISNAASFSGNKTFQVQMSNASGASIGSQGISTVTIVGAASPASGSLHFSATSYNASQSAGSLSVTMDRTGGSSGAISVAYSTADGTAVAGSDYTAASGTLQWADGDSTPKTISIPISNATQFSGGKTFTVSLSSPSAGTTISNPGTATATISGSGSAAVGSLQLSASSYAVAQNAGSAQIAVNRPGGSSGAVSIAYATADGTAVAGIDYTATSGTLQWADGDSAAKTFSAPVSNAMPFSGSRSFTIALSNPTGGAVTGSPSSATVSIAGDAATSTGSLQLSASSYTVAQSAGSLTVTVNRTGGSSGAVSVAYATANGTAVAGTDYTATGGTLQWADGDPSSKTFSVGIGNAAPFSGSKTFSISLSSPTGGATLSGASATASITGSSGGSTAWVYYNGVLNWGGDWSFSATVSYADMAGVPLSGRYDVAVTTQQWGGWQPYVSANCQTNISACFDTTPYKYLVFSMKPTNPNQDLKAGFMSAGDTPDGIALYSLASYCSGGANPPVGQWETCKVPLSAFGLTNPIILKFDIGDQTGLGSNVWYVDNVGFTAN